MPPPSCEKIAPRKFVLISVFGICCSKHEANGFAHFLTHSDELGARIKRARTFEHFVIGLLFQRSALVASILETANYLFLLHICISLPLLMFPYHPANKEYIITKNCKLHTKFLVPPVATASMAK